ncbi:MAG TPA: CTP synthase, partial [Elusimicrobiota bacterium]|nr:CTP synthase [Elusimicrobiota bacterium]
RQGLDELVLMLLRQRSPAKDLASWKEMVEKIRNPLHHVTIGVAGKYVELKDAYKSIGEALLHGGLANSAKVVVKYLDVEDKTLEAQLLQVDGILIPGGFGDRGVEGKIAVAKFAREHQIPFFGICLGMQCAVIDVARHLAKMPKAHSTEFAPKTPFPVVDLMLEQKKITQMGGSMRLGVYPCRLKSGSLAHKAYGKDLVQERHRHRYELNNKYRNALEKAGLRVVGEYPRLHLAEAVEFKNHPWYVAVQYHPELKSRPLHPHPLFKAFIAAALQRLSPRHG